MDVHQSHWRAPYWSAQTIETCGAPFAEAVRSPERFAKAPPLVLGTVANYDAGEIAPFLLSLRDTGYVGEVVLLASHLGAGSRDLLDRLAVQTINFDPTRFAPYHLQNARWFGYLEFFMDRLRKGHLPRQVLFTDVRDVIFQDDPFKGRGTGLDVFQENESARLGECPINRYWMRTCFGDHVARELAEFNVSCSGTVMGDGPHALRYLIEMWNVLALLSDKAAASIADQAAHNFIVHRGLVDGIRQCSNGGHIYTLHHVDAADVMIDENGLIRAPGQAACPIIHQYDRHPALAAAVRSRYAHWDGAHGRMSAA